MPGGGVASEHVWKTDAVTLGWHATVPEALRFTTQNLQHTNHHEKRPKTDKRSFSAPLKMKNSKVLGEKVWASITKMLQNFPTPLGSEVMMIHFFSVKSLPPLYENPIPQ